MDLDSRLLLCAYNRPVNLFGGRIAGEWCLVLTAFVLLPLSIIQIETIDSRGRWSLLC
jgi:hypothetical protein